jgi:hypothetical protein
MWTRKLKSESTCDDPGLCLLDYLADMRQRPELLTPSDLKFIRHLERAAIRPQPDGSRAVYLSEAHVWKLTSLARRFTHPSLAGAFRKRQAREASLSPEAKAARREKRARQPNERRSEQRSEQQQEARRVTSLGPAPTFYNRGFADE